MIRPTRLRRFLAPILTVLALGTAACGGDPPDPTGPDLPTVPAGDRWTGVAAGGAHACAWTESGALYCWGGNSLGQLGVGDTDTRYVPTRVLLEEPVKHVSAGDSTTCALTFDHVAYCWGDNRYGQVGVDSLGGSFPTPRRVQGGHQFVDLATTWFTTCGRRLWGQLFCWGLDFHHIMGGAGTDACPVGDYYLCAPVPVEVQAGFQVDDMAMGIAHICALHVGDVYCWGWNFVEQLGDPDEERGERREPGRIPGQWDFEELVAGTTITCGITASADVRCWGFGPFGNPDQHPFARPSSAPLPLEGLKVDRLSQVVASTTITHGCAVDMGRKVWCWGAGYRGALGTDVAEECTRGSIGPFPCTRTPVLVDDGTRFDEIAAGRHFACAIQEAGSTIWCWGANEVGQLGNRGNVDASSPMKVTPREG